jgi:hypothetical protein
MTSRINVFWSPSTIMSAGALVPAPAAGLAPWPMMTSMPCVPCCGIDNPPGRPDKSARASTAGRREGRGPANPASVGRMSQAPPALSPRGAMRFALRPTKGMAAALAVDVKISRCGRLIPGHREARGDEAIQRAWIASAYAGVAMTGPGPPLPVRQFRGRHREERSGEAIQRAWIASAYAGVAMTPELRPRERAGR